MKIACPFCAQKLDLSDVPPFSKVECPACKHVFKAPQRLDGFLLEEAIGEGRVSVVYRALDVTLDRDVAIKVLRRNVSAAPRQAEHFLAEARKLAVLTHPRVIPIFTCGEDDGSAYIGMQLMRKSSLSRWLREKREAFTPEFSLFVALSVAQGLEAACQKGIIHGNVSPQNILFDEDNEPRVGDFGMANSAWDSALGYRENISLCYSTVEYLSPELGLGGVGDERSDIYGLGAVLYHMLAGMPPFSGDNTDEAFRHRQENPPPALPPQVVVSAPVAELIASMLDGSPNRRPHSYGPVIALLDGQIQALTGGDQPAGATAAKRKLQLPVARAAMSRSKVRSPASIDQYMPKTRKKNSSLSVIIAVLFLILTGLIVAGSVMRAPWYVQYLEPHVKPLMQKAVGMGTDAAGSGETANGDESSQHPAMPVVAENGTATPPAGTNVVASAAGEKGAAIIPAENLAMNLDGTAAKNVAKGEAEKRPRPTDLDFKKSQAEVDAYTGTLDEQARQRELSRIKLITELRNEWMHSKISHDASGTGVRLNSGRTVRGMLLVNEQQMVMLVRGAARPLNLQWNDIGVDQYLVFLEDYVRQKLSRMGPDASAPPAVAEMAGNDCFRLAVLFDWYGRSADAAKYAREAVRHNPKLEGVVNDYRPGAQ